VLSRKRRTTSSDLEVFTTYLRVSRGLAEGTVKIYVRVIGRYLQDAPTDLARWIERIATSPSTFTQEASVGGPE
jgi:hypothetical protein